MQDGMPCTVAFSHRGSSAQVLPNLGFRSQVRMDRDRRELLDRLGGVSHA